jgi:hypothetical protein
MHIACNSRDRFGGPGSHTIGYRLLYHSTKLGRLDSLTPVAFSLFPCGCGFMTVLTKLLSFIYLNHT